MTDAPAIEREPLYMTDAEIIRRMGVPSNFCVSRGALKSLGRWRFPHIGRVWSRASRGIH